RLLAYHTVENIGIIFIGLGLALAFKAHGMAWAAALALTAGLLHVFNHSVFKSLLFFGAGAVLTSTGERDMEHLGGSSIACRRRLSFFSSAARRSRRCRRSTASSPNGLPSRRFCSAPSCPPGASSCWCRR